MEIPFIFRPDSYYTCRTALRGNSLSLSSLSPSLLSLLIEIDEALFSDVSPDLVHMYQSPYLNFAVSIFRTESLESFVQGVQTSRVHLQVLLKGSSSSTALYP